MSTLLQTKSNELEHICSRLGKLMLRKGFRSKEALARALDYSRTQLFMVESGERPITAKFLAALEREERAAGLYPDESERKETPAVDGRSPRLPPSASDSEITGLAALVSLHASMIAAATAMGEKPQTRDVPHVREALEKALESRGRLPRVR